MKVSNAVSLLASIAIVVSCFASSKQETGRESAIAAPGQVLRDHPDCKVDLTGAVSSSDIVSNALVRGLRLPARDVREFLDGAKKKYTTGAELMKATAARFQLKEDVLAAKVEKYKHCNCSHPVESKLHPILRVDMQTHPKCPLDLELGGMMRDTISNVLTLALKVPEQDVREFLDAFKPGVDDGPELFQAAAVRFGFSEDALAAEVQKFRHSDCMHDGGGRKGGAGREGGDRLPDDGRPVSTFAKDVTLHVVLHEIGHGLIREFDLPVLANEETMADAFATYYLTTQLPNRALDVLVARTQSLMIEANESPEVDWRGEHDDDGRRAYQIAALAIAADPAKYAPVADVVGMSEKERDKARDYGSEIRRAWRRILAPLWMPEGLASSEARVQFDAGDGFLQRACGDGLADELRSAVKRFDWHSQVTIRFVNGNGGAAWSRSSRTITVNSEYVRRFVKQGERGPASETNAKGPALR